MILVLRHVQNKNQPGDTLAPVEKFITGQKQNGHQPNLWNRVTPLILGDRKTILVSKPMFLGSRKPIMVKAILLFHYFTIKPCYFMFYWISRWEKSLKFHNSSNFGDRNTILMSKPMFLGSRKPIMVKDILISHYFTIKLIQKLSRQDSCETLDL